MDSREVANLRPVPTKGGFSVFNQPIPPDQTEQRVTRGSRSQRRQTPAYKDESPNPIPQIEKSPSPEKSQHPANMVSQTPRSTKLDAQDWPQHVDYGTQNTRPNPSLTPLKRTTRGTSDTTISATPSEEPPNAQSEDSTGPFGMGPRRDSLLAHAEHPVGAASKDTVYQSDHDRLMPLIEAAKVVEAGAAAANELPTESANPFTSAESAKMGSSGKLPLARPLRRSAKVSKPNPHRQNQSNSVPAGPSPLYPLPPEPHVYSDVPYPVQHPVSWERDHGRYYSPEPEPPRDPHAAPEDVAPVDVPQDDPYREQKIINEEYKIWKKNSPLLYDMLYARALEWPTLTLQWFPDKKAVPETNYSQHRLLFATHTSNDVTNSLQIATVDIPDLPTNKFANYDESRGEIGGHGHAKKPFEWNVVQRIPVESEVNKARYQPQNPNIIAATCADGKIRIFDRTKHPSHPKDENTFQCEMTLQGHDEEGFGLAWNPHREGFLATGTEDKTVRVWDIQGGFSKSNRTLAPVSTYEYHHATVNDVDHHAMHKFWIGTASDDLSWKVIDTRESPSSQPARDVANAHTDAINSIAFHPDPDYNMLVVTGSADKSIGLWDLRNTSQKIHSFEFHRHEVISLQWHPRRADILASSSNDRRICFWDLGNAGKEQTPEEAEDGPPELLYMHGGFTNRISDFTWNQNDSWVMAATAEDNQVQIFRPSKSLVEPRKKKPARKEVSD